jgi:glycine betaine/proline transport system permease protein
VQLPLALPAIMAGVNQVIMLALSMVVTAGLLGAAGLGAVVVRAVTQLDVASGFEGGLAVVLLAVFLDRLTGAFGQRSVLSRLRQARVRRGRQQDAPVADTPVGAASPVGARSVG